MEFHQAEGKKKSENLWYEVSFKEEESVNENYNKEEKRKRETSEENKGKRLYYSGKKK